MVMATTVIFVHDCLDEDSNTVSSDEPNDERVEEATEQSSEEIGTSEIEGPAHSKLSIVVKFIITGSICTTLIVSLSLSSDVEVSEKNSSKSVSL